MRVYTQSVDVCRSIAMGLVGSAVCALFTSPVCAQTQSPLPQVIVTASFDIDSAVTQAPTSTPLTVTQPTSVINQHFIEENMPLSSNYPDVVKISPSVESVTPNGPGLLENQILSIRGFVDGEYNVTFDGIPWGDSNDFTHHSTSYFMDHDLGTISVDRGPGTAATIGNATFCCTFSINSKAPNADTTVTPYVSYGSFKTSVVGAQFDTGKIEKYDGAAGFIDAESLSSDGYLTNEGQDRKNIFAKFGTSLGANSVLTFVAMYNQIHQYVGLGATAAQIAQHGPTYGLASDPTSQDYYGYNFDDIHTDFEYLGLASKLSDNWSLDNKLYTYAYYHTGHNGEDPNGPTPNGTSYGPNDVPGQLLINNYRSWGDTLKIQGNYSFGDVQAGVWADRQDNLRQLTEVDETLGGATNPGGNPSSPIPGVDRQLNQKLITLQPFVQLDWRVLPDLTLSPGVRYDHFEREVDASVNVKSAATQSYTNTFSSTLPSFVVHYAISEGWAAYAQAAKGFLAPNENFFNKLTPDTTNLSPQQAWSYQLGTSWQTKQLSLSADIYYIDFSNLITPITIGPNTIYINQGGAKYKGFEAEGTYYLGMGFSIYANGSINSAKDNQTGLWEPNAPDGTAAGGVIYNQNGWYASLIEKWVGKTYGDVAQTQPIGAYSTLDGALGYKFMDTPWLRNASIKLSFSNLLNSNKIDALAGYTAGSTAQFPGGVPLYWTIPRRAVFASLSVPF